jgi:Ca2+-binding RTX toxin-like protein
LLGADRLWGGAGNDRIYDYSDSDILITGGEPTKKLIDENTGLISLKEGSA